MGMMNACVACNIDLAEREWAKLMPCGHKICLVCLCKRLATKEHTKDIICPSCGRGAMKHQAYRIDGSKEKKVKHRAPIVKDIYNDPSDKKDPYRYWCKKYPNPSDRKGKGFIYIAAEADGGEGGFNSFSVRAPAAFCRPPGKLSGGRCIQAV